MPTKSAYFHSLSRLIDGSTDLPSVVEHLSHEARQVGNHTIAAVFTDHGVVDKVLAAYCLKRGARAAPGAPGSLGPPGCLVHLEPVAHMACVALLSDMLRLGCYLCFGKAGGSERDGLRAEGVYADKQQ